MQYDMGIIYHAKLKEVRETVEKLSTLSFDMTGVVNTIHEIEKEIEQKVQKSYSSFNTSEASCFLYDSLRDDYSQAIRKLDKINDSLKGEWESYYRIDRKKKAIENEIQNADETNIEAILSNMRSLLEDMKKTTTIDFNLEKNLVLGVYELAYKALKLELILTNHTSFLEYIKQDPVNIPYMVDLMKKDLEQVDKEQQEELRSKMNELEKNAIDSSVLLNKRLLVLLALYGNEDLTSKKKEEFLKRVSEMEELRDEIDRKKDEDTDTKDRIDTLTKNKKRNFRKRVTKRIVLLINTLVVIVGITSGVSASRNLTKGKEYLTTTTTYDSLTDELENEETYTKGEQGNITLVEYSPWDSKGVFRDVYRRNVYSYDISGVEEKENLRDYLTEDIKDQITYQVTQEESEEEPKDIGYGENKYIITRTSKDLDTFQEVDNPVSWSLLSILISSGIIGVDALLLSKLSKESLKLIKDKSKSTKRKLQTEKKSLDEIEEELKRLMKQHGITLEEVEEEFNSLPTAIQELEEVQEAKQKILTYGQM